LSLLLRFRAFSSFKCGSGLDGRYDSLQEQRGGTESNA
jgi:hypothetical protein